MLKVEIVFWVREFSLLFIQIYIVFGFLNHWFSLKACGELRPIGIILIIFGSFIFFSLLISLFLIMKEKDEVDDHVYMDVLSKKSVWIFLYIGNLPPFWLRWGIELTVFQLFMLFFVDFSFNNAEFENDQSPSSNKLRVFVLLLVLFGTWNLFVPFPYRLKILLIIIFFSISTGKMDPLQLRRLTPEKILKIVYQNLLVLYGLFLLFNPFKDTPFVVSGKPLNFLDDVSNFIVSNYAYYLIILVLYLIQRVIRARDFRMNTPSHVQQVPS